MDKQEIFEKVVNHLLNQKVRSVSRFNGTSGGSCAYRGQNNTSCAIGCLLTDEEYDPKMEFRTVQQLKEYSLLPTRYHDLPIGFLQSLQSLHDRNNQYSLQNDQFMQDITWLCQDYSLTNVWKV